MKETSEHPYLIAWMGYLAYTAVVGISAGFLGTLHEHLIINLLSFLAVYLVGFWVYRALVQKHIVASSTVSEEAGRPQKGLIAKYPYFFAWIVFAVLSIITNVIVGFVSDRFPAGLTRLAVNFILFAFIGFFSFKVTVKEIVIKHLEP